MWNLGGFPEETNSCKTCWNFFSRGCIIIFMSSFIFDTVSSDAKIYTEKTDYIEGSNVLLACKGSELEMTRWTVCGTDPLNGQSFSHWCKVTPQFRNHPRIKLLQQNCNQAMNWYNLSINGILWEDRGMYECTSGVATHKTITVYVPHKKDLVKIEQIMHRKYFNGTETLGSVIDLRPTTSDDDTVQLMCRSNCANPAPAIKWYGVSGTGAEKEELVIDSLMYNKMSESCADGLKRTISVLNLTAAEKSASQARQNITCELRQDLTQYGGPDIIAKQHMAVLYGDPSAGGLSYEEEVGVGVGVLGGIGVIAGVVGFFIYRHFRSKTGHEKLGTNDSEKTLVARDAEDPLVTKKEPNHVQPVLTPNCDTKLSVEETGNGAVV